jgi:hypothetical protein
MRSDQPPVIASWLLERFCADPGLSGDLIEEYRTRQSSAWYWKQAIIAVSVYPFSQIVEHKWLAARAIITGYLIWYVFNATILRGVVRPRLDLLGMDETMLRATYFVLAYALWLGNGWIIAKLHRPYSTAMVLAYALWAIVASVPPVYGVVMNMLDGSKDGSALAWEVTARVGTLLMLMSGGLLSTYRDQIKQTRIAGQDWRRGSPRVAAAR